MFLILLQMDKWRLRKVNDLPKVAQLIGMNLVLNCKTVAMCHILSLQEFSPFDFFALNLLLV